MQYSFVTIIMKLPSLNTLNVWIKLTYIFNDDLSCGCSMHVLLNLIFQRFNKTTQSQIERMKKKNPNNDDTEKNNFH